MEGSEGVGYVPVEVNLQLQRKQENEKLNRIILVAKAADNKELGGQEMQAAWMATEPILKSFLISRRYEEAPDVLQDFYLEKFARVVNKWNPDGGNFSSYCITVLHRFFFNKYSQSKRAGEIIHKLEIFNTVAKADSDRLKAEDEVAFREIKSKLLGWGESGVLRPMEGLALILRYCLGKDVAKRLIEKFTDRDSRFKGIDLETVNFNDEMFEEDIGVLVGTQQPAVSKMLKKAIRKIKEQLNY